MAHTVIGDTSRMVFVTSDMDYTIPAELCEEVGKRVTVHATATLVLGSSTGLIAGETSVLLYPDESLQLLFDGTDWIAI